MHLQCDFIFEMHLQGIEKGTGLFYFCIKNENFSPISQSEKTGLIFVTYVHLVSLENIMRDRQMSLFNVINEVKTV